MGNAPRQPTIDAGDRPLRIALLGEIRVWGPDGKSLGAVTAGLEQRLLIMLAMQVEKGCPIKDLKSACWDSWDEEYAMRSIEPPMTRLRTSWKLRDVLPTGKKEQGFHTLRIPRPQVDALRFIDVVNNDKSTVSEIDDVLALWQGDPRKLYPKVPSWRWRELGRALDQLEGRLGELTNTQLGRMKHLEDFASYLPDQAWPLPARKAPAAPRLLIVEDNPAVVETLRGMLCDYRCEVALNVSEAMDLVTASAHFDGVIVDRHLTQSLDNAGLTVLTYLRDHRPGIPRILLTSDHPEGPEEEIRRTFGLFEIVTKGGGGSSVQGIREVVDRMINDRRARILAKLDGDAALIHRDIARERAHQRRLARTRGASPKVTQLLHEWDELETEFLDEVEKLEQTTTDFPDDDLEASVASFLESWRQRTADAKEPR